MWLGPGPHRTGGRPCNKNTGTTFPTGLYGPAVHVLDRSANSHRETSSPFPTPHETHAVASQKQLEGTRVCKKVILIPRSPHPYLR